MGTAGPIRSPPETDGKWCLFAGIVAVVLLLVRRVILLNIIVGLVVGAEAIHRISKVNGYSVHAFGQTVHPASVGWGLWALVVGCACLIIGSWFYTDEVKAARVKERDEPGG
jgi:hypothetical protein